MSHRFFSTLSKLASLAALPLHAQSASLPTPEQAASYLETCATDSDIPSDLLFMAQAELSLENTTKALALLQRIPPTDPLYFSAAKLRIYIAHQHGDAPLLALLEDLRSSSQLETRQMATLMLIDIAIRQARVEDLEKYMSDIAEAELPEDLAELRDLYQIDLLRLRGDFQKALDYGRNLETDSGKQLSAETRARIRLKLADIYYTRAERVNLNERDRNRGRAEETLLSFISSYPESTLITDAFQMLYEHKSFAESNTALTRLKRWIEPEELMKTQRAAISLKMLFLLQDPLDPEPEFNYVNTALTAFPELEESKQMLNEAARRLLSSGKEEQAFQYINLIDPTSTYGLFFKAQLLADKDEYTDAAELFQSVAESDTTLSAAAHVNAIICALRSDQNELAERLIRQTKDTDSEITILSAQCAHFLFRDPERARKLAEQLLEKFPDSAQAIDARLDLIQLDMRSPQGALERAEQSLLSLRELDRSHWNKEQIQRFYALKVLLAKQLYDKEQAVLTKLPLGEKRTRANKYPSPELVIKKAIEQSHDAETQSFLTLYLGEILLKNKKYEEAIRLYTDYAHSSPLPHTKALAYLLAARSAEKLGSLPALKKAIKLYYKSSDIESPYQTDALIGEAAIHVRIGEEELARDLLTPLLEEEIKPEQRSHIHSILANAWAYDAMKKPELITTVLEHSAAMLHSDELPAAWLNRARIHHAHLCARFGMLHDALENSDLVIKSLQEKKTLTRSEWYQFFHASSAKITYLIELARIRLASDTADELGNWVREHPDTEGSALLEELASSLREWATTIRQQHFIIPNQRSNN